MKTTFVRALALLLVLPGAAHAQPRAATSLQPFGSERELASFLAALPQPAPRPAPAPPPSAPPCSGAITVSSVPSVEGPAVIRGRVADASGQPLSGASVQASELGAGTTSGPGGEYRLVIAPEKLPERRTVALTFARIGSASRRHLLALGRGDSVTVDVRMCSESLALEGLVVTQLSTESVTNVQHAGVDEGGIVKVHGDHLVMLRRGRLFTVHIGGGRLQPVSTIDAFGPGIDPDDAWYDELLISGDQVVVLGYSYGHDASEVGVFRIDPRGRLTHRATYHLRSGDYYSSRNYASRLVGSKLVMYTPLPVDPNDLAASLPAMRRWRPDARDQAFRPIVSATRVYRPAREVNASNATLHTVTVCDLARPELTCEGTAVLGSSSRVFYVSPSSVYVWVSDWGRATPSVIYRMPLSGAPPSALRATGTPVDQFSFLESADGHLNVLVREGSGGDAMWRAEPTGGETALLRVPLSRFADGRTAAPLSSYRRLPAPRESGVLHNRFVGGHLLYGSGNGWESPAGAASVLYAVPWAGGPLTRVSLPHGVDRIEVMGSDAVVVGADTMDLHFTGIALRGRPRVAQRYVSRGASQGELRSHGFFYRAEDERSGVLGLPINGPAAPGYEHLLDESSAVLFLHNEGARFSELGQLAARAEGTVDDHCISSCTDWYGNSRPLFLRGRILALLGYEIVEGTLTGGRLRELRRVSYAPAGGVSAR